MAFLHFNNYKALSKGVAQLIIEKLETPQSTLLGLSTGFSPKLTYELIAKELAKNPKLIPKIKGFQIDEWLGLGSQEISSCQYYIQTNIIDPWQIPLSQCFCIDGLTTTPQKQILSMQNHLTKHPMDLCILGIGQNGHLALNEPGSNIMDTARIVSLEITSQQHNMLTQTEKKIQQGITIGLKEILASKEIFLLMS